MNNAKLAKELVELLMAQGRTITTVESCTGGLIAGAITSVSGSSAVFEAGFVTYSNVAKTTMVGVSAELIDAHGAVSIEVAASMAQGALKAASADMALSVTGIAGPSGGTETKPIGMVCFGLSYKGLEDYLHTFSQVVYFGNLGRDQVREAAVKHALTWAVEALKA